MPDGKTLMERACRGERTGRTPVWVMRQAGRYMAEYRALKEEHGFLSICRTPKIAAQATLDAARYLGTDAAIIFSDITLTTEDSQARRPLHRYMLMLCPAPTRLNGVSF